MKKRVISAIIFGLIFFPAIYFGGIYFLICSLFISFLGTFELMNMFYKRSENLKIMRFVVPAFSSLLVALLYVYFNNYGTSKLILSSNEIGMITDYNNILEKNKILSLIIILYFAFIFVFTIFTVFKKNANALDFIYLVFSLTYSGVILGLAFSIEHLNINNDYTWPLFTYVYSVVCLTDIFAYFIGSKFGRHKLCPHISPKKSVEGAIGGIVFSSVFGTLIAYLAGLIDLKAGDSINKILFILVVFLFSIILSIVSQIGDLILSRLKRYYEIKDFGNIMPGHGGILDRFDSFILSGFFVMLIYLFIQIII